MIKEQIKILKIKSYNEIPKNFTGIIDWQNGTHHWYKDGEYHRLDGPSVAHEDGTEFWYKEGRPHRLDGPAIIYVDGSTEWWIEGKLHREDGPAVEHANGTKVWYKEGLHHREDGPAVERSNGTKEWWVEGKELCSTIDISNKVFLGIEKGRYDLEWLKFFTENGIQQFPIVPGMPPYEFKIVKTITFDELIKTISK